MTVHGKLFILAIFIFVAACADTASPPSRVEQSRQANNQSAAADTHDHGEHDDVPRISIADAKKHFDARDAIFIDTHGPEQFANQHIPGAINIPGNDIGNKANGLPKGKKIIAYCS